MCIIVLVMFGTCPQRLCAQIVGLSTNLAEYVEGGTLNVEASMGFSRHWSVDAGVAYNPYYYNARQRSISIGGKFWPWHVYSGWWMSGKARWQEFNENRTLNNEGDRWGPSISGGYSRILGKHFNLDIGLGIWGGYEVYTTYACEKCGRFIDEGSRFFILPDDITIALTYIF